MKLALCTISVGDFYNRLAKHTHPLLKKYAEKINADFIVLNKQKGKYPHYIKCQMKDMLENKYDRILYVDTDVIIRPDSPNLFDIVPYDKLGIFNEGRFTERVIGFQQYLSSKNENPENWDRSYYNTGVFLISKPQANVLQMPEQEDCHFYEQSYINYLIHLNKTPIYPISYRYNRMCCMDPFVGEHRLASFFVHYAGLNVALPDKDYFALVEKDISEWIIGNYYPEKNVAILVGGGLGDTVSAEPTVRFICQEAYKKDNCLILTHHPAIFKHLGKPTYKPNAVIPNFRDYVVLDTLKFIENEIWKYISPLMLHACDIASVNTLKRALPMKHRQINLAVDLSAIKFLKEKCKGYDLTKSVVLHPGKGWKSKTFPKDIWDSYINILVDKGYPVVLIGKHVDEINLVVDVDGSRTLNLIDKLSIEELIACISMCPVLISNDSAPIHIAGAFDNWIGLIATCKHPECILPYRNGDMFYKSKSLEVSDLYNDYNSLPTNVDGERVDDCKEERLRECLPKPEKILEFVKSCF